jgi:hypothetical protein
MIATTPSPSTYEPGKDVFTGPLKHGKLPFQGYVDFLRAAWERALQQPATNAPTVLLSAIIDSLKTSLDYFMTQAGNHPGVYETVSKNGALQQLSQRLEFYQKFTLAMGGANTQTWGQLASSTGDWPFDQVTLSGDRASLITQYVANPILYGIYPQDFSQVARGALAPNKPDAESVFHIWNLTQMSPEAAAQVFNRNLRTMHTELKSAPIYGGGSSQAGFGSGPVDAFNWVVEQLEGIGQTVRNAYSTAVSEVEKKGGREWWVWAAMGAVGIGAYMLLKKKE